MPPPNGEVPIIALTAHAMAGSREEYIAAGMNDYVSKPINPTRLVKLIETWGGLSIGSLTAPAATETQF